MLKIKLTRRGKRHQPVYRVIVAEAKSKRDGKYLESLGHYDPNPNPVVVKIDKERYQYWIGKGAQPTETVANLFKKV